MGECNILVMGRTIEYDGLFDLGGFIKVLDLWFKDRNYNKRETKNFEEVYEDSRQVTIEMFPYKKISDNIRFEIRLFMIFSKLKDTTVEKEGKKIKILNGHAMVSIDGYMITDYEDKWDKTPFYYFMRTIFDRYIHRDYISQAKKAFMQDVAEIEDEMKSYLNMFRYK
ncbi:MAG: hypothetical protein ABIJ21_08725 [Nanoarchaeota archaeon]